MVFNFFLKKAIGLQVDQSTIKYALVTYNKNKIIVNESQSFDIHCKTALQRLQTLSRKYPTCILSPSSNVFFTTLSWGSPKSKDKKKILKNKIEPLLGDQKIIVQGLKRSPYSFFIAKEGEALKAPEGSIDSKLPFQKKILDSQALFVLEDHLPEVLPTKLSLYLTEEKAYFYFFKEEKLNLYLCESIKDLSKEELLKKILRFFFAKQLELQTKEIYIYGAHPSLNFITTQIEKRGSLKVNLNCFDGLEKKNAAFLVEIGAALSLLTSGDEGLSPVSLLSFFKIHKASLALNSLIIVSLFFVSSLYWNHKLTQAEAKNKSLYQQTSFNLKGQVDENFDLSYEKVEQLQAFLKKKKKENPPHFLEPPTFLVSDTLAWLSCVENKIRESEKSAFFVLEDFNYRLTTPPQAKKRKSAKQVKVTFSFSTNSSQVSRRLYEEVSKATEIVDTSQKIDWHFQNDKYEISFFLKRNALKRVVDA